MHPKIATPAPALAAPVTEPLLTNAEASALLGFHPSYLAKARLTGAGPPFLKIGARSVRYRRSDIDAWLADKIRISTADNGG